MATWPKVDVDNPNRAAALDLLAEQRRLTAHDLAQPTLRNEAIVQALLYVGDQIAALGEEQPGE